jgi:hypothetical protein
MSEAITKCLSPVCDVEVEPGGLEISPRAYCCEQCRKDAWVLRRASKLVEGLSDQRVIEILRGSR